MIVPRKVVLAPEDLADVRLDWPIVRHSVLASGAITRFVQDRVQTPDGGDMDREYLEHPGAVGIIALDAQERVALVRQYRHPVRFRLIEPPAGLLDVDGEDFLLAAKRELAEEVDLAAGDWRVLVDFFTTPGILAEALRVFLARDLTDISPPEGFLRHGEEAFMDTVWAPLEDLVDAVLAGRLQNPTLVVGVLAAWTARHKDGFASLRPADAPWPARDRGASGSPAERDGHRNSDRPSTGI